MTQEDLEDLRAKFIRIYSGVPHKLREEIIVLVGERPFNWNAAFLEINGNTKTGNGILKNIAALGLLDNE